MPAVEHEEIQPEKLEKEYTAIDRERHQDHYQTKVQPIQDKEVLPEQHHHVKEASEKKIFHHGDNEQAEERLEDEADELGVNENKRKVAPTVTTEAEGEVIEAEHVHHHIHENIQPVIEKETIEPHVVHKTKAVHEVHHEAPKHHEATQLPPVTMDEFKKQNGRLDGAGERTDTFEGEPRPVKSRRVGATSDSDEEGPGYIAPSTRQTEREVGDKDEEPGFLKKMVMGSGL